MNVGDYAIVLAAAATSPHEVGHKARRWAKRHGVDRKFLVSVADGRLTVWRVK